MLTTYDRALKAWRLKQLKARLERERPYDDREVIPGAIVALLIKRAEKETK